ncbi:MAG TPA: oligosaccharide flippase family protein [Burkholderiaceae bacterium]
MSSRQHTSRSLLWSLLETFGSTGFSLLAIVVLARVLSVEQMGLGSLAVLIAYLTSLPFEVLFHDTLVQRKQLDERHVSSAFAVTAAASTTAAALAFLCAPAIASAYGQPPLAALLRGALAAVPLAGMSSVVSATLRRRLAFAPLARRTIVGRLLGVSLGVATAFIGGGAWSMVVMQVASIAFSTAVLLSDRENRPALRVSWAATRELLGFALPNMAAQLMLVGNSRIFLGVFAFFADAATFGRFSLAFRLVEELRNTLCAAASQLALPLLARQLHDRPAFASVYRKATGFTVTILLPLYAGFGLLAPDLVPLLFGAKWQGTELVIQVLCVATMLMIVREFSSVTLTALGFPGANMKINAVGLLISLVPFVSGAVGTGALAALVWTARAAGMLAGSLQGLRQRAGLSLREQLAPAAPALLGVSVMAAASVLVLMPWLARFGALSRVTLGGLAGGALYLATLALASPGLLPGMASFVASAARRGKPAPLATADPAPASPAAPAATASPAAAPGSTRPRPS